MAYIAESVPQETIKSLLVDNWDPQGGVVPMPRIEIVASIPSSVRFDIQKRDYIFIAQDNAGEEITLRNTCQHYDKTFNLVLQIMTSNSRQRLYDIKKQIRIICFSNVHNFTGWQRLLYRSFIEEGDEQPKIWKGRVRLTLDSARVPITS